MTLQTLQTIINNQKSLTFEEVKRDRELSRYIQSRLHQFNLLKDVDGVFGTLSLKAITNFADLRKENETGFIITPKIAKALIEKTRHNWLDGYYFSDNHPSCNGILQYFLLNNWTVNTIKEEINLVALRGINRNGSTNADLPFKYNDRFIVFKFEKHEKLKQPVIIGNWLVTSQPGKYYWDRPLNKNGCAVQKGNTQFKAWSVGYHRNYLALVQTQAINVIRGAKRFSDTGYFGINIHSVGKGKDFNFNDDVGLYSAGCTVFASRQEFDTQFMRAIYISNQYIANANHLFEYAIIDRFRDTIPFLRNFQF